MPDSRETAALVDRARAFLEAGATASPLVARTGRVEHPIAVETPTKELHSWFVPVEAGGRLAGFFQFLPDLTLMRYSTFQRREDSLEACPDAKSWLDPDAIRRRALERARPNETAGQPWLTYDRNPSRLAWAVPLASPDGASRTVWVAGRAVWEASPAGPESYGGCS